MKKLFYLLALPLIFLYGCAKEDSGLQKSSSADLKIEKLAFDGKTLSNDRVSITLEELQAKSRSRTSSRSLEDSGANGHFSTNEGNTVSFSSGDDGELGNWNMKGVLNFKGDVICATIEGNQAVIQIVITQVGKIPEEASGEIVVGYTWFFLLEDNGEGSKAPSDRYYTHALYAPGDFGGCIELPPSVFPLFFDGCGCVPTPQWSDTAKKSDQIQIKG